MTADLILAAFETQFREQPKKHLLISQEHLSTVGEVEFLSRMAEASFRATAGPLQAGTPVGLAAVNGTGFLAGLLALRRLKLPAVLLEAGRQPHHLQKTAEGLGVQWILCCDSVWPESENDFQVRAVPLNPERAPSLLSEKVAVVKLTSGSTGLPRGVVTSTDALVADDRALAITMGLRADERILAAIPFSHSYGLASVVMPALMRGSVLVLPRAGNPFHVLPAGTWGQATFFPTIPAWVEAMVKMSHPPAYPSTLRLTIFAGAPLKPATAKRFHEVFGQRVHVFYGSSESGGICFDRVGDAAERGCLGTPVEGVKITLEAAPIEESPKEGKERGSNREQNKTSPTDSPLEPMTSGPAEIETPRRGLVSISSPAVAEGYWPHQDPVLAEGRFQTHDLAEFRDRELVLIGRVDDLINVKGKKVNPREIEQVLRQAPGVEDVAVLGVSRPGRDGEFIRAFVVVQNESASYKDLHAFCRNKLPDHKVPRSFRILDALPTTARGKLDRAALRNLDSPRP